MSDLHKEIGRLFRDLLSEEGFFDETGFPLVDILDAGDNLKVEIELPGVEKNDIKLEIAGDSLVIEGTKRDCEKKGRTNYICMERRFGYFKRAIRLPVQAEASDIQATYEKGVLRLVLRKIKDRRKDVRVIEIK